MLISIGGNIGVGKSTILDLLKGILASSLFKFITEPVDTWTSIKDSNNVNVLEHFYTNPQRYAFNLQVLAFITRLTQLQNALKRDNSIIITERSLEEDRYIFAEHLTEAGFITEIEMKSYEYWFDTQAILPDLNIFLKASPETCYERIKKRNRPEEKTITLDYLKALDKKYFKFLTKTKSRKVFIDCDQRLPEEIAGEIAKYILLNI